MSAGPTLQELLAVGYQFGQIIACPWNDQHGRCPCQLAGPQKDCALGSNPPPMIAKAVA